MAYCQDVSSLQWNDERDTHAPDAQPAGREPDFEGVIERRDTGSIKWDRYNGRDVIPLWVADMDFGSPPAVIQALHRRIEHGVFGYTHASDELEAAVVASLDRDYAWEVPVPWLVWIPGLVSGLNVVCRAVGEPGDDIITFTPIYPPFLTAPGFAQRTAVRVPLALTGGEEAGRQPETAGRWTSTCSSTRSRPAAGC